MVQPNYAFQKRQRDLAKKQKKEEKKLRKASGVEEPATPDAPASLTHEPATPGHAVPAGDKTSP